MSEGPFVGLRPYEEREAHLFFGRDAAARALGDEILSSPVTVLFAPSGAGKSSVLKTLVIPRLRQADTYVAYVDSWPTGPLAAQPVAVVEERLRASIPARLREAAATTLVEIAQHIHAETERGVVLVLDQFEQVLLHHPAGAEELARVVGALVRFSPDAHVVFALREEYLGKLDALRPHLLNISRSRHRLEGLSPLEARQAIEGPLHATGGEIEAELVDRLLEDLRFKSSTGDESAVEAAAVSLPFLQIVCSELWVAAQEHRLDVHLYERLGERRGIVRAYVDRCVRNLSEAERTDMARLLDRLAPKAGVKMAYPVDLLFEKAHVSEQRGAPLLARLEEQRILRRRAGGKVVEVFHDAFSEVLREFIDRELLAAQAAAERRRRRRKQLGWLLMGLLIVGVPLAMLVYSTLAEQRGQRAALFTALKANNCQHVAGAVHSLLERADRDFGPLERLVWKSREHTLRRIQEDLHAKTARQNVCASERRFASSESGTATLTIRYNDDGGELLSPAEVQGIWALLAEHFWGSEQRLLPLKLSVVADRKLVPGTYVLENGGNVSARRALDFRTDQVALLTWQPTFLEQARKDFSKRTGYVEEALPPFEPGAVRLGYFEAWSAPLWMGAARRVAASSAQEGEVFLLPAREAKMAAEVFRLVAAEPARFLTEDMVTALLLRQQQRAPCLMHAALDRFDACSTTRPQSEAEAQRCRGAAFEKLRPLLREVLVEMARGGYRPGTLPHLLDRIADVPAADLEPRRLVQRLREDLDGARPSEKVELALRRQPFWGCRGVTAGVPGAYDDLLEAELEHDAQVLVRVGARAANAVGGDRLSAEVLARLDQLQIDAVRRNGVPLPPITFRRTAWTDDRFSIEVRGRKPQVGHAEDWRAITSAIEATASSAPAAWISTDDVVDPFAFKDEGRMSLYGWFESRYSRNDVKLVLRRVLAPPNAQQAKLPESTIEHQNPWLLGAFTFWAQDCKDPKDGDCLAEGLRANQRARFERSTQVDMPDVRAGVAALDQDDPNAAVELFRRALKADAARARSAFLSIYPDSLEAQTKRKVKHCEPLPPGEEGTWGGGRRSGLVETELALASDPARKARLRLCSRVQSLRPDDADRTAESIRSYLRDYAAERAHWSSAESYWLGYYLLLASARREAPPAADLRSATELLAVGLRGIDGKTQAPAVKGPAFSRLTTACGSSVACLWALIGLAEEVPEAVTAAQLADLVDGANTKTTSPTLRQIGRLRALLERAVAHLPQLPAKERGLYTKMLELIRLWLEVKQQSFGAEDVDAWLPRVDTLAKQLRPEYSLEAAERHAFELRATFLTYGQRWPELTALLEQRKTPAGGGGHYDFQTLLRAGNVESAAELADRRLAESGWADPEWHFRSAMMHLLLKDGQEEESVRRTFLYVRHHYRDYLRLLLWWRFMQESKTEEARRLLEERILEIPRDERVGERLSLGDLDPWRDRLVRYFQEPESAERRHLVLGEVAEPQAFARSELSDAGQSYQLFRCEAFFYDALLQSVSEAQETRVSRCEEQLAAVLREGCQVTYEYDMSRFLLNRGQCASSTN